MQEFAGIGHRQPHQSLEVAVGCEKSHPTPPPPRSSNIDSINSRDVTIPSYPRVAVCMEDTRQLASMQKQPTSAGSIRQRTLNAHSLDAVFG